MRRRMPGCIQYRPLFYSRGHSLVHSGIRWLYAAFICQSSETIENVLAEHALQDLDLYYLEKYAKLFACYCPYSFWLHFGYFQYLCIALERDSCLPTFSKPENATAP